MTSRSIRLLVALFMAQILLAMIAWGVSAYQIERERSIFTPHDSASADQSR